MISEKKINYYLHFAKNSCNPECKKIIMQLVDEVRKLECEANWLTEYLSRMVDNCPNGKAKNYCSEAPFCMKCWRERARKAVEKNDS